MRSYSARNRTHSNMVKIIQPTNCFPCLLQVPVNTLEPTLLPQLPHNSLNQLPVLLFPPNSWSVQTECPDYLEIHTSMFSSPSMPYRMRGKTSTHTLLVRIFRPAGRQGSRVAVRLFTVQGHHLLLQRHSVMPLLTVHGHHLLRWCQHHHRCLVLLGKTHRQTD
jgi:hypothetical protein